MTNQAITHRRRARLLLALAKLGFASVQEAASALDANAPYESIRGVGAVLGETMREWLAEIRASGA